MRSLRTQITFSIALTVAATIIATCILSNVLTSGQFYACMSEHFIPIAVFSLLFAAITGHFGARQISGPVSVAAQGAEQIAAGQYDIQIAEPTKTEELHHLVVSVNHLATALARQKKLRRQLTADVAHELRTPLATLGTHLEAMIEGVWEPSPERLASCHEEILRLGKIVADLEHLERVEGDNIQLDKTPVDLLKLAHSVGDNFAGELAHKNLRLDIAGESAVVSLDKDRISGVIGNLLSNAVKYTPEGGQIQISVQDHAAQSVFVIADDGAGIPENELPFIFERFYRADKSRNRSTGGAGIGLAIVKSVVEAHGGAVHAENNREKGSRFVLTLPKE